MSAITQAAISDLPAIEQAGLGELRGHNVDEAHARLEVARALAEKAARRSFSPMPAMRRVSSVGVRQPHDVARVGGSRARGARCG